MELFSIRRKRLVLVQSWNKFGYGLLCNAMSLLIYYKHSRFILGPYELTSPATKELHGMAITILKHKLSSVTIWFDYFVNILEIYSNENLPCRLLRSAKVDSIFSTILNKPLKSFTCLL